MRSYLKKIETLTLNYFLVEEQKTNLLQIPKEYFRRPQITSSGPSLDTFFPGVASREFETKSESSRYRFETQNLLKMILGHEHFPKAECKYAGHNGRDLVETLTRIRRSNVAVSYC